MDKTEIIIFILLTGLIVAGFLSGIMLFALQYKRRRTEHEQEKRSLQEQHQLALVRNQAEVQKQTMLDIGRELHDNIGQKLTLASIYAQQMEHEQQNAQGLEKLNQISAIINESLADLRELSQSLTDSSLEQLSLDQLIRREGERVNASGRCRFMLESEIAALEAGYHTKIFVMRLLQEFIQNSLKHSRCKAIYVQVRILEQRMVLMLKDDGQGFDPDSTDQRGQGLNNMKQRAALLGADFSLTSKPGAGTELHLHIPLSQTKF